MAQINSCNKIDNELSKEKFKNNIITQRDVVL